MAGALIWPDVPFKTRVQGGVLLVLGAVGMLLGLRAGGALHWHQALGGNANLIAMLAAVSFLRLITKPGGQASDRQPDGVRSVVSTLAGVQVASPEVV